MSATELPTEWDAIVIGAGPAGALAARQLALRGRRTLLLDKKRFPRPKVCGACINARAVSALAAAGLADVLTGIECLPLDELNIVAEGRQASIQLPQGVAVGRAEFDQALANSAVEAGATFCDGVTAKVGSLSGDDCRKVGLSSIDGAQAELLARVVIAADGLQHASLHDDASFASEVAPDSLIGLGATVPAAGYELPAGIVRMVVGPRGYVGLVRLAGERLNMAAAVSAADLRRAGDPAALVAELLRSAGVAVSSATASAEWHGTGALTRTTQRVADQRLFVLGDATGYVEPFTGEGIAWALCSALLAAPLADACATGRRTAHDVQRRWEALHRDEVRRRQAWCRRIAWVLRTAWRRRLALAATWAMPWLARRVVGQISQRFDLRDMRLHER
jgi:flavin-dependent dehydrogenase